MANEAMKESLQKEAAIEKQAEQQLLAMDAGMERFIAEQGWTKADFAKCAGLENPNDLVGATLEWVQAAKTSGTR